MPSRLVSTALGNELLDTARTAVTPTHVARIALIQNASSLRLGERRLVKGAEDTKFILMVAYLFPHVHR